MKNGERIVKLTSGIGLCFFLLSVQNATHHQDAVRPNILFIVIDDLNDWVGYLHTHPQVQTPHLDAMARAGVAFTNAHCPAPICGPSRTAVLSGLWPTTSGMYTNAVDYRRQMAEHISLPEYLRNHGYHTLGTGKIFHAGISKMPEGAFDEYGEKGRSSAPFTSAELSLKAQDPTHEVIKNGKSFLLPLNGIPADRHWNRSHTFDWGAVDLPDSLFADTRSTNWAVERLDRHYEKPFFMAVGLVRPHQPLYNPQRFHDLYPPDEVVLPPAIEGDLDDVPRAGKEYALAAGTSGLHASVVQYGEWEHAVSSYLASISYVDELVGQLMNALRESDHADNTLVVLWSDHGWHLGQKEHWGKATGWLASTRVPLIIIPPQGKAPQAFVPGQSSERVVNLLDLAPTLAEAAALPPLKAWEGKSLWPLVADPDTAWQEHTHTTFGLGNHTISTNRWQYIHYFDGSEELYDLWRDPHEFSNLAGDPRFAELKKRLHGQLPPEPQWKYFIRYHNFKAVIPSDESPLRLYNLGYRNQVNEQTDVAEDYPQVVSKIERWLVEERPVGRYLSMENDLP